MTGTDLPRTADTTPGYDMLADALSAADQLVRNYNSSLLLPTHARSQLRLDLTAGGAASCFNTASAGLAVALDHLTTWSDTVCQQGKVAVYANYSLARPAYECALRVLWLLDPTVDSSTRIARGYSAQLVSLDWMRKFQESLDMKDGNAAALDERVLNAARTEGFVVQSSKGKEVVSVSMPTAIELFDIYDRPSRDVKAAWIYRFLSGHSHGFEWAAVRGGELFPTSSTDLDLNKVQANMSELVFFANRTVSVVARATTAHINYRLHVAERPSK